MKAFEFFEHTADIGARAFGRTLEELFEVLAWSQLGWHPKPVGLLDIAGFYRPLLEFLDHATSEGFLRARHRALVIAEAEAEKLIHRLKTHRPPPEIKRDK